MWRVLKQLLRGSAPQLSFERRASSSAEGSGGWARGAARGRGPRYPQRSPSGATEFTAPNTVTFKGGSAEVADYPISPPTQKTLARNGIKSLFPVQTTCFEHIFAGKNVVARERTGAGKTLAYALPVLERFRRDDLLQKKAGQAPLKLVLVPTRELATQVMMEYVKLNNHRDEFAVRSFLGGVPFGAQLGAIGQGFEVAVATPGRLLSLVDRELLSLAQVRTLVLDETDLMLDMGFKEDIERLFKHMQEQVARAGRSGAEVQHLLFSATVPGWMQEITHKFLHDDFLFVDMLHGQPAKTPPSVDHLRVECRSPEDQLVKLRGIVEKYCGPQSQFIVFADTKYRSREVFDSPQLDYSKGLLNGDVRQFTRERTFRDFRSGEIQCLVATDLAARGLDFPNVDLVVMLSPPENAERYIHRAGRTGRAGKAGVCVTCYLPQEAHMLREISQKANIEFTDLPSDARR